MVKCPKCGYENQDEAPYCNLCYITLRKEKKEVVTSSSTEKIRDAGLEQEKENSKRKIKIKIDYILYILLIFLSLYVFLVRHNYKEGKITKHRETQEIKEEKKQTNFVQEKKELKTVEELVKEIKVIPKKEEKVLSKKVEIERFLNKFKTDNVNPLLTKELYINEPVELDFLSKDEILLIRKMYVNQYPDLIEGEYSPNEKVYGNIVGGKPWWGLDGQFYYGAGERSIEGLSEESRCLVNPFLLLGVDEGKGFRIWGNRFLVAYPKPKSLLWYLSGKKTIVTYDLTTFYEEKKQLNFDVDSISLTLMNTNARDFGFSFLYAPPSLSKGVYPTNACLLFNKICTLKGYIHLGNSCGYKGGCNNESPNQPELYFYVRELPATLFCKLWKELPKNPDKEADFTYIINFE